MIKRWTIRSLRRFNEFEMFVNSYLTVGGTLSPIYAICGVLRTRLYEHVLPPDILTHSAAVMHVAGVIIWQSILRTVLWFPQIIYNIVIDHQSLWDWLTAAHILKELIS